jgi:hypothetical protein
MHCGDDDATGGERSSDAGRDHDAGRDAASMPHSPIHDAGAIDAGATDASTNDPADASAICEAPCAAPHLTWSDGESYGATFAQTYAETYALDDCRDFIRKSSADADADAGGDSGACATTLPCTGSEDRDTLPSIQALQSALADPEVRNALARDAKFGFETQYVMFALDVPGGSIRIYDAPCDVIPAANVPDDAGACEEAPEAVRALRILLDRIAAHSACAQSPAQDPACTLEFDAGDGKESTLVYAFNAHGRTCELGLYSGHGGNANRFESLELCRASCPTTARPSSCAADRSFVIESCLQCGVVGGCSDITPLCATPCTTQDDCTREFLQCSPRHICEAWGCV